MCLVEGCDRPKATRGYCHAHYRKLRLYGDPIAGKEFSRHGAAAAFLEAAKTHQGDECLIWPCARNSAGYGHLMLNGKNILAHRIVCEAFNGPVPFRNAEAAHLCGNGHLGCVNGRHLQWKTRQANSDDREGHGTVPRGEKQYLAKLTSEDVHFIWHHREISSAEIARRLNVCAGTVVAVRARKSWKWLTDTFPSDPTLIQADQQRAA